MRSIEEQCRILKAIAHPDRVEIILGLKDDGCNVGDIQTKLGLPQSTISHHLLTLKNAGILRSERNGTMVCYCVEMEEVKKILEITAAI
ncbi:MAG: winged helix-turn-helix transcriptional regulator [Candidatus Sabulitectum sp.]|nr:winged helix-turn-helix transcriptional regulator [Candidatus Sabulitectum sp.]